MLEKLKIIMMKMKYQSDVKYLLALGLQVTWKTLYSDLGSQMFFNSCHTLYWHHNNVSVLPHDFQHIITVKLNPA